MATYSGSHKIPTVQEFRETERQREQAAAQNESDLASDEAAEAPPRRSVSGAHPALSQFRTSALPSSNGGTATGATVGATDAGQLRQRKPAAPEPGQQPQEGDDVAGDDEYQAQSGQAEKDRLKQQSMPKGKPTDSFKAKGERKVDDPTTGGKVIIADDQAHAKVSPDKLEARYFDGDSKKGFSTNWPNNRSKHDPIHVSPFPAEPSNILIHPFPEPLDVGSMTALTGSFHKLEVGLAVGSVVIWLFTAFGSGFFKFFLRSSLVFGGAFLAITPVHLALRQVEKDLQGVRTHMHTQRGQSYAPPIPESVEWLNAMVAIVWRQIDPATFIPMADQIEDVMQQSVPGFIQAVKISDLSQGTNPFRFICLRALADVMGEKGYPRAEWMTEAQPEGKTEVDSSAKQETKASDADGDGISDDDEAGDFYNVEASFSYSARPGTSNKDRAENIHLLIEFFLGAYDLFQVPLPVWVQIEHISGTIRLRCQFISSPPYIRNVTFSLMGVPKVEVSVQPMAKAIPNLLDMPLISGFVQSAIAAAANEYVAPKSMTMNMEEMLSGGAANDTTTVGVLWVKLGHGEGLSAQDRNGKSDPYVNIAYSKFGRPLFSSRIIFEDLNPNFNECVPLLVTKDDIRGGEELSIQLWDSDERTADDIVGRIKAIPLGELMKHPNKMHDRKDQLAGFEDADEMIGSFSWSVGYYEKNLLNKDLQKQVVARKEKEKEAEAKANGEKYKAPAPLTAEQEDAPADATLCPPDSRHKSAILGITVASISALATREVEEGLKGKEREGSMGQDVDATQEGKNLPSAYCEIVLNDDILFKTRVKPYSNAPVFNAGTEAFVRDWTQASVTIIVRDARLREHDPILGIVSIHVADAFKESSTVSAPYSLGDGIGYGRVNLTMNLRTLKLDLPRELSGWDTATVEMLSQIEITGSTPEWESRLKQAKIRASTGDDTQRLKPAGKQPQIENGAGGADSDEDSAVARLPVYDRYSSFLTFDFGGGGLIGGKPDAIAVFSLAEIADNDAKEIEVAILTGPSLGTLKRNYIDEFTKRTHKFEEVGKLRVKIRVDSGLDEDHERLAKGRYARHAYDVYDRTVAMPERAEKNAKANDDGIVDRKEQKSIDQAKTRALHARHRGAYGYTPVRTSVWAKDGMKERFRKMGNTLTGKKDNDSQEKKVTSEA